ncbi:uncharacterized protein LOC127718211 [Mytilus californianus]|uniref:uncharacterized protein LOC127718211 n=1 Tax=Mytilus californianus TaxID=6549 RepID=UPI0022471DAB|nr:uncharacterized protein LOC127718211 [Mytilus californianus]
MEKPTGAQKIENMYEYHTCVRNLTHVAVVRTRCKVKYFHHYLVLDVGFYSVDIIHYTPGNYAKKARSVARVTRQTIRFDETDSKLLDFSAGVFFITRQEYPSTGDEMEMAYLRASYRSGEAEYSLTSNNCESFVTWVLTGEAKCEQFEQSGAGKRILMDVIDSGIDHRNKVVKNGQSDLPTRLSAISLANAFTNSGDALLDIAVTRSLIKDLALPKSTAAALAAKAGATTAAKVGPSAVAAGVSAGITAAVAVPVEAVFCGIDIHKLNKQKKNGLISEKGFKRQVTKKVSGSASSVAVATGTGFLGAFIGQIVCPIPVVGGVIGGTVGGVVGSLAGRATGSVVSGKIFDAVTD